MAISAKKKAALREKETLRSNTDSSPHYEEKRCTCLVAIRGRGQHAISCALFEE